MFHRLNRIAELMNNTYAYKHKIRIGTDGHTIIEANFALPKLIHLMGHDLIDPLNPKRTLLAVELANAKGIDAVKHMESELASGASVDEVAQHHGITLPTLIQKAPANENAGRKPASARVNSSDAAKRPSISKVPCAPIRSSWVSAINAA